LRTVYIAGKFRGPNAWEIEQNIRAAEVVGMEVAKLGAAPVIPHANTRFFHGTITDDFWLAATMALLERCDAVMLVPGWPDSKGALAEIERAMQLGLPIFYAGEYDRLAGWLAWDGAEPPTPGGST
jgi:hypothetical protein